MDEKEFIVKKFNNFVTSEVAGFLEKYSLDKVQIVDENGNKAKITRDKDNNLVIETTTKEIY